MITTSTLTDTRRDTTKAKLWTGRVLWALGVPFMLMDTALHLTIPQVVVDASLKAGIPLSMVRPSGILELVSIVLYLVPRTAVIGAILLTGYLGGAVATNLHTEQPFWMPFVFAAFLWGSLYCRDKRVAQIFA